jgi:DNA-binding Lrp family transcriptional regulator
VNDKNLEDMDDLDIKLLKILSKDDRVSLSISPKDELERVSLRKLADILDKSPVTIKNHLDELEKKGIIKDYGITIDYEKLGFDIIALIELTISKGKMLEVERDIAKNPNIFAVYDITGEYDAIMLARFRTRAELSNLVKNINSYEYVIRTNTHLILNVIKEGTDFAGLISQ